MSELQSMTGYGKSEVALSTQRVRIEIKALNGKFSELNIRVPRLLAAKEIEIRKVINDKLQRGSISVYITVEKNLDSDADNLLNHAALKKYYSELNALQSDLGSTAQIDLSALLQLPEVISKEDSDELSEEDAKALMQAFAKACDEVTVFRIQEGKPLKDHLQSCNKNIRDLMKALEPFENERTEAIKEKLRVQLETLIGEADYDRNRLEQEMIYYIEKLDINEEKQRLENHCNFFNETLNKEPSGKKLSFISQEIGREINTIGSKSNNFKMQQIVVQMKDELERIKEQVNNVL